jgi:hypothetical protein
VDGVVVSHMLCVTVLEAVDSGCTRLTVKLLSADDVEEVDASALVVVDAEVEAALGRIVFVVLYDADEICNVLSEAAIR